MSRAIKVIEQLRKQVSELIQEGDAMSLEKARTLLNHQQLLLRQVINEECAHMTVGEMAHIEADFMKANEKLLNQKP